MYRYVVLISVLVVMRVASAAGPASTPATSPLRSTATLWVPGHTWALVIDGAFLVSEREISPGGRAARFMAEDRKRGVMVSAFIEPAIRDGDATVVRETFLKRLSASPMPLGDIVRWEASTRAMAQFTTKLGDFGDFRQTSMHVYVVRDAYWIDVHFSTMDPRMAARLRDMVSAVRFVDDYQPSEDDRLAANAPIRRMEEGLTDRLTPVQWKQLLLKIAIAYGESGQIREAREVLIKGQMRYPDYPLFYYNLACADALEKNVDGAIINLRMAWRNKANLPPDESLPDPLRDSSFSEMLKNRNVRNTVIEIMQGR